jgi:hypothetical protein
VEAKAFAGSQPDRGRSESSIQSEAPRQLGHQPMGIQTGVRLLAALGQLAPGCVRRSVVLHDEQRFLLDTKPTASNRRPIGSIESHLSYDFNKLRCWSSLDGNFWFGGTTSLNDIPNSKTRQTSQRIGRTASFPFSKRQSIKVSYSNGTYERFGGNYQSVSVGWQYSWLGAEISHAAAMSKPKRAQSSCDGKLGGEIRDETD